MHKLSSSKLRAVLDSVCFEPGRHLRVLDTGVLPAMVPTTPPRLLATGFGHLLNELHCSPANVLRSVTSLLTGALALDTGAVCDVSLQAAAHSASQCDSSDHILHREKKRAWAPGFCV